MSRVDPEDEWVFVLKHEQLIDELNRRRLPTEGSYSILTARLLRRVRGDRTGIRLSFAEGEDEMSNHDHLELPPEEPVRPDSPMADRGSRESSQSPRTPRSAGHQSSRGTPENSAMTAYNVMRKWNLKFSGTRGEDAETFLMRIEEGRDLVPVADEDILRCLPFFLSGIALHWFRGKRNRLTTWATFKSAWRTRFGDPDFQFALRDEVIRRTQGEQESVADYITCLRAMFDRLAPPWSDAEQVSYAFRNLLPRLQIAMRRDEVEDLDALEDVATRVEGSHQLAHRYRAPPTPEKSLFPDLAYRSPRNASRHANRHDTIAALNTSASSTDSGAGSRKEKRRRDRAANTSTSEAGSTASSSSSTRSTPKGTRPSRISTVKCWNCDDIGHLSRDCEAAPRRHCYRCGRAEVTLRTCPDCTGNGAFGCRDESSLLFLRVGILGKEVLALLDSGSSRTFLGPSTVDLVKELELRFRSSDGKRVTTATGQTTRIKGEIEIPITLRHQVKSLKVYALPTLALPCIIGVDFLSVFGIGVNFATKRWYFSENPMMEYEFDAGRGDPSLRVNASQSEGAPTRRAAVKTEGILLGPNRPPTADNRTHLPKIANKRGRPRTRNSCRNSPICCGLVEISATEERRLKSFLESEIVGDPNKPGVTDLTQHRIDVGNHAPIKQRYYPVSPKIQEAIYAEVDKMLEAGIIEPSKSEWSSPVVMVKKSNGTYRFCLDFRRLNSVSKKDAYPLPYMNAILDKLRAARYISTIDLSQAYFQVPLENNSRELTAFTVPGKGLFHFTRMPFGLIGAPATFQRLLDRLIGPEMEPHAFAYLDDIVIVTRTFEEHLVWLKRVLDRIKEAGLTINPEKSKFCRSQVKYLGFLVQQEGLKVDPDKTEPIVEYPPPKNIKQLRRFIGMASWYRRFIPQCATKLEPLTRLLRKNYSWEWGDDQKLAFEAVKSCITSPPTLSCPKFELPFVLQTDASSVGLGAVLTQESEGVEHVIAFASRALSEAEKKYSTTEQECLAVVWAIRKFRPYLEGYKFRVITDHSCLRWLHNLKNPTGRLARWALELLEYDYVIEHRKGALHHVPDALSRVYESAEELCAVAITGDEWYDTRVRNVENEPRKYPGWRIENDQLYFRKPNPVISQIVDDLEQWKRVLPKKSRLDVIRASHDTPQAGHLGTEKTYQRVAKQYYWPRMFREVANYTRRCDTCQRTKVEQNVPAGLMGRRKVETPWTVVAADIMGPFPVSRSGFAYLLVLQDLFTKWVECCPLRKANGRKIREAIDDLIINR
ncbi:uncharacterized protein [Polyergus mexicanus]|uniref:uncharacterized protein n=1 Tax=Polyergus mexicanus TaxID=615972 RepID=UPI0038B4CCE9